MNKEINLKKAEEKYDKDLKENRIANARLKRKLKEMDEDKEIEQMRKELREVSEYNEMLWRYGV